MSISQKNLYSILNWQEELDKINLDFLNLIKEEKPHYTTLIEILNILNFLGEDEKFFSLLEKIKTKINSMKEFIPWYHFFLNLITIDDKEPEIILEEIDKYQKSSSKLPKMLQEGLIWLKFKILHKFNLKEHENIDFDQILHNITIPWWYWQILFIQINNLNNKGENDQNQEILKKTEKYISDNKLKIAWSKYYNVLGIYQIKSGRILDSIQSFSKGIEIAEILESEYILAQLYCNLGNTYLELGYYNNAEKLYQKAFQLQSSSKIIKCVILNNIGYCNYCKGDFNRSLSSYSQAKELIKTINTKRVNSILGFTNLGFGLHKSREAKIEEAKEHFKVALEMFKEHNDNHGEIYTHGMVARVFLDIQEFEIAEKHFKLFLKKIEQTNSYENFFSFYCLYIQFLLDKNAKEDEKLIEKHLRNLEIIASKNKDNLNLQNWYKYIQANLEEKQFNLSSAEEKLKSIITQSQKFENCELTLRSIISLSEVLIRKYTILKEEALLEEIFDYLSLANNKVDLNPIFPMNIYIKIYLAMIYSQKRKWEEVDELLAKCREILELSGTKKDHYFYDLLNQIEGNKVIFGDLSKGLIQAFNLGLGKFFSKEKFKESEIGLIIWKFTDYGPSVISKSVPEKLVPREQLEVTAVLLGTLLTTLIGQGEKYHEGIYGPLPVPSINTNEQIFCQVNTKIVKDSSQTDERLKDKNYVIIAVLYGRNDDIDRLMLINTLKKWWKTISDLGSDNTTNFVSLKQIIVNNVPKIGK